MKFLSRINGSMVKKSGNRLLLRWVAKWTPWHRGNVPVSLGAGLMG